MSNSGRWFVEVRGYDSLVRMEVVDEDGPVFIADCGAGGEAHLKAKRIVADHNACLGIRESATTVPELVAALDDLYQAAPLLAREGVFIAAMDRATAVLAKTGKKPAASSGESDPASAQGS